MDSERASLPSFPRAQQAQIIRANQRDLFYVSSLREQAENVLRTWLGNRWLSRWDKEVELLSKLLYYGFTTGRGTQTLGEEYTSAWQNSIPDRGFPSVRRRAALVFLPALPAYLISRFGSRLSTSSERMAHVLRHLPTVLDTMSEINLAVFYFSGVYYSLVKRLLRVRNISSIPKNPNARSPSYSLLGILIGIRLLYRLVTAVKTMRPTEKGTPKDPLGVPKPKYATHKEVAIDGIPISDVLGKLPDEFAAPTAAEEDEYTALDFTAISEESRARRNCTLCLEERTASCATECGHLFCWSCVVGWGREKAECPLCRQSLSLTRLVPIYNL